MAAPHTSLSRRRLLTAAAVLLASTTLGAGAGYARDEPHVTSEQAMQEYREMIIALYGPQPPQTKAQTPNCPD